MTYDEKVALFATKPTGVGDPCPNCELGGHEKIIGRKMDHAYCDYCGWTYGGIEVAQKAENFKEKPGDPIPGLPEPNYPSWRSRTKTKDYNSPEAHVKAQKIFNRLTDAPGQIIPGQRKVYLAGPMTGIPDYNAPAFRGAAILLRGKGWEVISPVELDENEGVKLDGMSGREDSRWKEFLARDLIRFIEHSVDAIVVLDGWERSKGATLEVAVAQAFDIPVLVYPELTEYNGVSRKAGRHPASERFHEILASLGDLHDRKQKDYGRKSDPFSNVRASDEWDVPPWVGAMIRANDKIRRLQTFAKTGTLANEGVEDAFMDLAVYAVIGLVLYEQENNG